MQKPNKFTVLSDVECVVPGCSKRIKANLVARKAMPRPLRCFKHHTLRESDRGHFIKAIPRTAFKKALSGGNVGSLPAAR